MTITPELARKWLDNATPGPWDLSDGSTDQLMSPDGIMGCDNPGFWINPPDATLICFAPDMAETIAGMRLEWGVRRRWGDVSWIGTEAKAREWQKQLGDPLVRRLVGPVE